MADIEKERLEGFNAGYMIEKHRPELSKQLVDGLDGVEVPFVEGFIAGSKESEKEKTRSKSVQKLRGKIKAMEQKTPSKDKEKDLDIDR